MRTPEEYKWQAVVDYIKEHYDPSENGQGYWENGNYDDAFEMGKATGSAETMLHIGRMLGLDLPDIEEMTFD